MRSLSYLFASLCVLSALQAQELTRGSYNFTVDEMRGVESSVRLTLTGPLGAVLYQIKREMPYDTPRPQFHLFADGSVLLVDAFAGVYERYGENGRMSDRIPLDDTIGPNHERIVIVDGNDSTAVLLLSEPGRSVSRIMILDLNGMRKFDRLIEGAFASELALSPDGRLIAAGTYTWDASSLLFKTEFLRTDGTSISSIDHEFKGGSWSPDGKLFALYGRKQAMVIDVPKNEILATTDLGVNKVVHQVFWDDSIPLIVCSPSPTFATRTWIYSGLTVLNLVERRTIYRSELSFRRVTLEKNAAEISLKVDDRSTRIK